MSLEPDWRNCGCACVNRLVFCRTWEPNSMRGPRNANSTPGLLLRSSHRLWELPAGRWDDNSPAEMPRACTVRTSHPAHLPCCSTSFASAGLAWATARLLLVTVGSPAVPGPWACRRKFFSPTEAETVSQTPTWNISAALLCLQVAKIHILFTSTLLMWGSLSLIAKARKSWARLASNYTLLSPTSLLVD